MTNLILFHPGIVEDAIRVRTTSDFEEDTPVDNLTNGERHTRVRLDTASSWIQTLDFELQSGTTQTANFFAGAVWDSLRSTVGSISFRGASASYFCGADISSITAWYDTGYQYYTTPSTVQYWVDRTGNGFDMQQTNNALRFSYIPAASASLNGWPAFKGAASAYMVPATSFKMSDAINAGRFTIWGAIKTGSDITTQQHIYADASGFIIIRIQSSVLRILVYDGGTKVAQTAALSTNTTYMFRARHDGSNIYISVNQGTEGSASAGSITQLTTSNWIGYSSNSYLGHYCELIFSNQNVGSAQTPIDYYLMAKWVTAAPVISHTIATDTLYGPRENDFYTTFTETGGFRYWWITYNPSSLTELYQSKAWGGLAFDMGVDADYEIDRIVPSDNDYTFDSGARRLERIGRPLYRFTLTWTGVSDAKVTSFQDIVARYSDNKTFFLATTGEHQQLDNQRLVHCKLISAESQKEGGIADWNIVRAEFEEIPG